MSLKELRLYAVNCCKPEPFMDMIALHNEAMIAEEEAL